MANGKVKKDTASKAEKSTAIDVGKTITDPVSGKQVINFKIMETEVRKEVASLTGQLQKAMSDLGTSALRIGEILSKVELLLKPRGVWVAYLNSLPGFTQPSAYRFIRGYRNAKEKYTPAILSIVLTSGMDMIGDDNKPYGKYTDVVKKLPAPKPTGDEAKDKEAASQWLTKVEAHYRESRKKGAVKIPDSVTLQKEAFLAVLKRYGKVPNEKQLQWVRDLFAYILGNLQFAQDFLVEPKDPPKSFVQKANTNEDNKTE
jgi:hypothetical protein